MNTKEEFFDLFSRLGKKRVQLAEKEIIPLGLSHTELKILMLLYNEDGQTQDMLSSEIILDRTNVGRALKKLEKNGYITRKQSRKDRRINLVFLTKKAVTARELLQSVKMRVMEEFCEGLSQDEIGHLVEIINKMTILRKEEQL